MIRVFSEEKREELYEALDEIDLKDWKTFKEWCGSRINGFGDWMEKLDIQRYMSEVDAYQNRILNVNNSTRRQIDIVFANVAEVDRRYAQIFREYVEVIKGKLAQVQAMIDVMRAANGEDKDEQGIYTDENVSITYAVERYIKSQNKDKIECGKQILLNRLIAQGITDRAEQQKIIDMIVEQKPGMLVNLYITDCYSSADSKKVYDVIVKYYINSKYKDVDYVFEQISEKNVSTKEEMFSLNTYDLLARMIYQEMQDPKNGRQNKVLWATINRYFSEKNFTYGRERTLRIILEKGGYESIDINNENKYNAYHPNYDSEAWENAKLLASILYSQVGEANADDVNEEKVREVIRASQDIYGNNIENTVGNCDSFYGDGEENYFYEQ